jgi:hypothetical protein
MSVLVPSGFFCRICLDVVDVGVSSTSWAPTEQGDAGRFVDDVCSGNSSEQFSSLYPVSEFLYPWNK